MVRTVPETPPPAADPLLRRSTWLTRPTPALLAAQETLQQKQEVRDHGEDWVTGGELPMALQAGNPYAYLSALTHQDDRTEDYVPKTYGEAMRWPDLWKPAMDEELRMMKDRGMFELVDEASVSAGKNIVGCCWVFANKYNAEGEVTRCKARLVAKGYSQIAAQDGLEIWQVDFISAYLNSIPEHEVYMRLPPGFPGGGRGS